MENDYDERRSQAGRSDAGSVWSGGARSVGGRRRGPRWYAVRIGRVPGVYTSPSAAQEQCQGYRGAAMRAFRSEAEALGFAGSATARPAARRSGGSNFSFYAVRVGRRPGVYRSNREAQEQVVGVPRNEYKGFRSEAEAWRYVYERVAVGDAAPYSGAKRSRDDDYGGGGGGGKRR